MQPRDPTRVNLHSYIVRLAEDWEKARTLGPENQPTATEVTRLIWDAEETGGTAYFPDANASPLHLADLLRSISKNYFGGHQWSAMEDYINRLTSKERRNMQLDEFAGIFYDILRDHGEPDDAEDPYGRWPLGDFNRAAKLMFDVHAQPFVKSAWAAIEGARRPDYQTLLEETRAKIRLMALARICLEFSNLALEQYEQPDFELWAEVLEVPVHCLGQLVGTTDAECNQANSDLVFSHRALKVLTDQCRAEIFAAMLAACGGVEQLHAALLLTYPEEDETRGHTRPSTGNELTLAYVANGLVRSRS